MRATFLCNSTSFLLLATLKFVARELLRVIVGGIIITIIINIISGNSYNKEI